MFHNLQCKRIRQFHFLRHCCFETYWTRGERHYQVNVHDKQCISQASKSHVRSQKDGENVNGTFESWVLCLKESQWATTVIWVCFRSRPGVSSQTEIRAEQCGSLWTSLIAGNFRSGPVDRKRTHSCYWPVLQRYSESNNSQITTWVQKNKNKKTKQTSGIFFQPCPLANHDL